MASMTCDVCSVCLTCCVTGCDEMQLMAAGLVASSARIAQGDRQTNMPYPNVGRARAAKGAAFLLLLLLGQSKQVNNLAIARAQPSSAASPCIVLPKLPLSVGFLDSRTMNSSQFPNVPVRDVLRGVKSWLCGPATLSPSLNADSLRSAIEQHQTLLFEEVRFDTQQFKRAHVLLTDSRIAAERAHTWKLQVDHANGAWRVTHAGETE